MDGDLIKIKIKIAGREYPMTITANEEENIRNAGRVINERLKIVRDEMGLDDKQDLLAMVAFDFVNEKLLSDINNEIISEHLTEKISCLDETISEVLTD